jgi:hypothetical protein
MVFKEMGCDEVNWIFTQDSVQQRAVVNVEMKLRDT